MTKIRSSFSAVIGVFWQDEMSQRIGWAENTTVVATVENVNNFFMLKNNDFLVDY